MWHGSLRWFGLGWLGFKVLTVGEQKANIGLPLLGGKTDGGERTDEIVRACRKGWFRGARLCGKRVAKSRAKNGVEAMP